MTNIGFCCHCALDPALENSSVPDRVPHVNYLVEENGRKCLDSDLLHKGMETFVFIS